MSFRRKLAGVTAGVLIAGTAVSGTALADTSETQASGTPDDYWWYSSWGDGYVMWNDYDTEDPSIDYDNLIVKDNSWDGSYVWATWENGYTGEMGTTRHLKSGDSVTVDVGSVPKGEKVHFWLCVGNGDNAQDYCDDWEYFVE